MSDINHGRTTEEMLRHLQHYEGLHELTEQEQSKVADLSMVFFSSLRSEIEKTFYVGMVRAIFNLGYECGQKSGGKE